MTEATRTAEIYTKPSCPYCVRAKALMDQKGISYKELQAVDCRDELIERVKKDTGNEPRTLPQIYLDGEYVGGYTELANLLASE